MSNEFLISLAMLGITALLIAGNALYVFHEFAFVVIRPVHIKALHDRSRRLGRLAEKAAKQLDHYIAVDQLGITMTSLAVGWIGQPALADLLSEPLSLVGAPRGAVTGVSFGIAFLTITVIQMIAGELMPKTIALRHPQRVASLVTYPVEATARLTHPVVWVLNGIGGATVRMFGLEAQTETHTPAMPAEELELVIQMSARGGVLDADPEVLRRALHFSDLEARDVLLPRHDVAMVSTDMTIDEVLEVAREHRHTRYPVFRGDADSVIGLLNVKELIQIGPDGQPAMVREWQRLVRPIPVLPEYASIEQVLATLSQAQQQMALLIDEYGGMAGILTVSDIASRLIRGEEETIQQLDEGRFLLAGDTHLDEVERVIGASLVDEEADFETVGGLIMAELERVPRVGDEVRVDSVRLRVASMRGRRVMQVRLELESDPNNVRETSDSLGR